MSSPEAPLVILNIQINESETESVQINRFNDVSDKIGLFCKNYHIANKSVIAKIESRVLMILRDRYPFLAMNDNSNSKKKEKTITRTFKDKTLVGGKKKPEDLTIDTGATKFGIQHILYSKKGVTTLNYKAPSVFQYKKKNSQSFATSLKPKPIKKNNPKYDKENIRDFSKENDAKLEGNIKYGQDNPRSNTKPVDSTAGHKPLISFDANFGNINKLRTPTAGSINNNTTNLNSNEISTEARQYFSNLRQAREFKKSSFCREKIAPESLANNLYQSCIPTDEYKSFHLVNNDDNQTNNNSIIDNGLISREKLKTVFNQLDASGLGYIGPNNINLKSLSADCLKLLKNVIISIFKKDYDSSIHFDEFCAIVDDSR